MKRLLLLFFLVVSSSASAQLKGYVLTEFQRGNIPFNGDFDFSTLYTLTQLSYNVSNFEINTRLERFDTPINDRNYTELTQFNVRYVKMVWM